MEIMWALTFFFAFITLAFVAFACFFPEWVGITGKKALEIQAHQAEDSAQGLPADKTTQNQLKK
jgi:hypothetical protein